MAESFWKALGTKLVETGAAYLQQVRVVNELKQLSPQEARARFAQYAQGLSNTARAGFAVTLAALEKNEASAEARRLIGSLRASLLDASEQAAAPPAVSAAAPMPASAPRPTFDEDLQRVGDWYEVDDQQREALIAGHLAALDADGLRELQANLDRMRRNCAEKIDDHQENEARIAGGRFVEDQMAYRMAVLRTGQHDPQWLQQLRELEQWRERFGLLHHRVELALEQRQRPAAAPAPQGADALRGVQAMKQLLEQQIDSGEVRGERAVALRRTLAQIEAVLAASDRGEIGPAQAAQRIKQVYADSASMLADPGAASRIARATPRQKEIDAYAGAMKVALGRELMESPPAATASAIGAVLGDLTTFQQRVAGVTDDDALAELERDVLRPAARARHELAMTRHALLARPLWESVEHVAQVNAVAYSGAADLQQALEAALAPRRLAVAGTRRLQGHGQVRWDELNRCHVAVFDLRRANDIASLVTSKPKRARELVAAAYELGMAFALGKPVVVVASPGTVLPFDVDLAPLVLDGDEDDAALLQQAVDEAMYVPQRAARASSIAESIAFLDRLTAGHPKRRAFEGMGWLDPALARDPATFAANTEQMIRDLGAPPWRLLRPAWPGTYAEAGVRRCFHVMPFGPDWADAVRDAAREACAERGFLYRRGDEAEEGRIIQAIWDDLCRADLVLVDLTGANLNVMIELGIAHAIGRPVLAVQQRDAVDVRPRHIEKLRFLSYGSPQELTQVLRARLNAPGAA